MIDKSNGNATIDALINNNGELTQAIFKHAQGLISDDRLYQIIGYSKHNEGKFVPKQWWYERKHFRNSGSVCPSAQLRFVITPQLLQQICRDKQYNFDDRKQDFTVNLFAIHLDVADNVFVDILAVVYWYRGKHVLRMFDIACDPSLATKPMLAYGHYQQIFHVTNYRGKYDALCQKWGSTVSIIDCNGAIHQQTYGLLNNASINLICAQQVANVYMIDPFCAGQHIIRDRDEFDTLISLCRKHVRQHGSDINYTVLSHKDLSK